MAVELRAGWIAGRGGPDFASLAALNHRVYADLVPLFADIGLSGHLHRKGALTVYESENGWHAARSGWEAKRRLVSTFVTYRETRPGNWSRR